MQLGKIKRKTSRTKSPKRVTVKALRKKTYRRREPSIGRHATRLVGAVATAKVAQTAIRAIT